MRCSWNERGDVTAVQPYGIGDGDKEERLELRTRSAATVRSGSSPGRSLLNCSRDLGNQANGPLRIQ